MPLPDHPTPAQGGHHAAVIAATKEWLEKAVIGLNLCPFAKSVHVKGQIRYVVCDSPAPEDLLNMLDQELKYLAAADSDAVDTTLLIAPQALPEFLDFNDFVALADALLAERGLDGELQIASFHPAFRFAGTAPDDITNYTNRTPYPTLHLLREASIDRAVEAFPDAESIYERNMETMRRLGHAGWAAMWGSKVGDSGS